MHTIRKTAVLLAAPGLGLAALALLGLAAAPAAHAQGYALTTLASFSGGNGQSPLAGLTLSGGTLYGTTANGGASNEGTVFSVPVTGGAPTTLAAFSGSNGAAPFSGLTLSADGSILYGTTTGGGASNRGTVFSVPVTGGSPTDLFSFSGSNGANPQAGLTLSADGSTLYGTTASGGTNGQGTVFSVPVGGGTPTTLANFTGGNGTLPLSNLTLSGGMLYGTTEGGGAGGDGTVFSVPVGGGAVTDLFSFTGGNGTSPFAGLTLSADGSTLYGTTNGGGTNSDGIVFSVPVSGGTPTTLAAFSGGNGQNPVSGLTLSGGMLYGTTEGGGPGGGGTVFSVPAAGGALTDLVSFTGLNGSNPHGGLTLGADGTTFYGTTANGGVNGGGTVFSLTPNAAPVPEASSVVSFGLLLLGGLGAVFLRGRKRGPAG